MVGNLVLRLHASGAIKCDFLMYMRRYTSQIANFEYGYPHFNAHLQFCFKLERCKPPIAACHPKKCDITNDNDVKLFPPQYILSQILDVIPSDNSLQDQVQ